MNWIVQLIPLFGIGISIIIMMSLMKRALVTGEEKKKGKPLSQRFRDFIKRFRID